MKPHFGELRLLPICLEQCNILLIYKGNLFIWWGKWSNGGTLCTSGDNLTWLWVSAQPSANSHKWVPSASWVWVFSSQRRKMMLLCCDSEHCLLAGSSGSGVQLLGFKSGSSTGWLGDFQVFVPLNGGNSSYLGRASFSVPPVWLEFQQRSEVQSHRFTARRFRQWDPLEV